MPSIDFDAEGFDTWHTPANMVPGSLYAHCWGQGAAGLDGTGISGGEGGGGGAYAGGALTNLPDSDVDYNVGGPPNITDFTTAGSSAEITAAPAAHSLGGPAIDCTGDVIFGGGDGAAGDLLGGGGGGGSATELADGEAGHGSIGGIGEGNGGAGGVAPGFNGQAGFPPGGGGGGGFKAGGLGGAGTNGRVRFVWAEVPPPPPPVVSSQRPGLLFATRPQSETNAVNATQAILTQLSALLGADTTTIAGVVKVGLAMNNFTPGPQLIAADITPATFTGSTIISVAAATRPDNFDPATGDRIITITPPAGGYLWSTTDTTALPQTIYGFYLGSSTPPAGTLYGAALFDQPITLTAADQQVAVNEVAFRLLASGVQ